MRRKANRRFYRWLFRAYRTLFPTPTWNGPIPSGALKRVLVIQRWGVGDMVLTTPLLSLLRERVPDAEIDVLASSRNADVLVGDPAVTRVFVDGRTGLGRLRVALRLRARRYDAIFAGQAGKHLREALTASLIARSRTYKVSIWRPKRYQGLFTTVARIPPSATHTTERLLYVGQHALGMDAPVAGSVGRRYSVRVGADDAADARAAAFLAANGIGRFVVLNVAAHFAVRDWPPAACASFLALLLERHPELQVVVTRAPGKEAQAAEVVRLARSPRVVLAAPLPLLGLTALIRRAAAIITVDTALVHLGSACGRPVVALYAPMTPADVTLWLPIGVPYRALASPLRGSVADISPVHVADAARELLAEATRDR